MRDILCWIMATGDFIEAHEGAINVVSTAVIAFFTIVLAVYTKALTRIAIQQHTSTNTIERAYVKMSAGPPGLNIISDGGLGDRLVVNVEVKNFGETPAKITDVLLKFKILQTGDLLPEKPDYTVEGIRNRPSAYLVKGDWFFHLFSVAAVNLMSNVAQIRTEVITLILFGYVDYTDSFGKNHRAGFARRYEPDLDNEAIYPSTEEFRKRSNLVFVMQDGYNYDRQQSKS